MSDNVARQSDNVAAPLVGAPPPTPIPGLQQAQQAAQLLEPVLQELRKDVREVRGHSRGEFFLMLSAFALGFLVLATMSIEAYRWAHEDLTTAVSRLEGKLDKQGDQVSRMNGTLGRVEQKLDDLIHPLTPLPRRQ